MIGEIQPHNSQKLIPIKSDNFVSDTSKATDEAPSRCDCIPIISVINGSYEETTETGEDTKFRGYSQYSEKNKKRLTAIY